MSWLPQLLIERSRAGISAARQSCGRGAHLGVCGAHGRQRGRKVRIAGASGCDVAGR